MEDFKNFKIKLEVERKKIEKELSAISKQDPHSPNTWNVIKQEFSTDGPLDLESESDEVENFVNRTSIVTKLEERINNIDKALKNIEKGVYGTCINCNKKIPIKRLKIMPEAETCLKCSA